MGYNIAIDGPAGAGKSTVAREVAAGIGGIYIDTGALYRAIALYFIRKSVNIDDEDQVSGALEEINVTIAYEAGEQQVLLCGENVNGLIRTPEVTDMASRSSALPEVRAKLLDLQRDLARDNNAVMDGRDIGTVVLPGADLKIFLTASAEERARRRYLELEEKGTPCDMDTLIRDIKERDERDMNRASAPLKQAEDAILLDTSSMTREEVVQRILGLADAGGKDNA